MKMASLLNGGHGDMKDKKEDKSTFNLKSEHSFDLSSIGQYHFYLSQLEEDKYLDHRVINDLDVNNFFKFIDRTYSAVGQQYLYNRILSVESFKDSFDLLEEDVAYYAEKPERKEESQKILQKLTKSTDYYFPYLIFSELPKKVSYLTGIKILQVLVFVLSAISFFYHFMVFPLIAVLVINMGIHYMHKNKIGNFIQYFYRLNILTKCSRKLLPISKNPKSPIIKKIKQVEKLSTSISFLKTDSLQESEIGSVIWVLIELLKVATLGEITLFYKITDHIAEHREDIHGLYKFIGGIDIAISIGLLRFSLPYYSTPKFDENKKEFQVAELYHPLIPGCVANDLKLTDKSLMLSGSNMSGKSTFIKSVGLNAIASQTFNTSFTKEYLAPTFRLLTSMKISDDIQESKSYYLDEVVTVGDMIEKSEDENARYLFIIDEIFKGTNTIERISGGKAILSYLNRGKHLVLIATHDIELTNLLGEEYDLYYFQEKVDDNSLAFDYQIKKGRIKNFNAIKIMEISGYPASIVQDARALARKMEEEKNRR